MKREYVEVEPGSAEALRLREDGCWPAAGPSIEAAEAAVEVELACWVDGTPLPVRLPPHAGVEPPATVVIVMPRRCRECGGRHPEAVRLAFAGRTPAGVLVYHDGKGGVC